MGNNTHIGKYETFNENCTCTECSKTDKILSVAYNTKALDNTLSKTNKLLERIANALEKKK